MAADAERNRQHKSIEIPLLYLRGDADGGSPDAYVNGLKSAGAQQVESGVLHSSGELAPLETPQAFIQALRAFTDPPAGKRRAHW